MGCPSSSMSRLVCATSNRTWPSIKPSVRHRCSPSSIRSGSEMANGSAKARRAVSKLTPCLRRFAAALTGSHSNQVFIQICYNSFAVQRNLGSRCHAAGKESCYAAAWLICLSRAPARQPPPGRNAGWAAAAGFPVIPTHENRAFPLSVTGTTGAAWRFRGARPSRPQFRAAHCLVAMPGILAPLGPSESGVAPPPGTPSFASISMKARRSSAVR